MNALRAAWAELAGLFVDDWLLAAMTVVVVVLAIFIGALSPVVGGVVLVLGAFFALLFSVMRAVRQP